MVLFDFLSSVYDVANNLMSASITGKSLLRTSRLPEGDDTSMEELLTVLGEKRLKKVARKNRRKRNQKIREGKVVLNEKGEWVPRE